MKRCLVLAVVATFTGLHANAQHAKVQHTGTQHTAGVPFKKLPSSVQYKIVKDVKVGVGPKIGDVVKMNLTLRYKDATTDTLIMSTRKNNKNQPVEFAVPNPGFKGDWTEAITLMTPGDSAVFLMPVDSLRKSLHGNSLPPFIKDGHFITVTATLESFKPEAEARAEAEKAHAAAEAQAKLAGKAQAETDEQILKDYLAKNNIKAMRTESGLYYTIDQQGTGPAAMPGQTVTMNYTGKDLTGKAFDSNTDSTFKHVSPFKFKLGQHMVIQGWDEGIAKLNKGTKGRLFIPSGLAYGPNGHPPVIAQNAILVFDVEVVDISDKE